MSDSPKLRPLALDPEAASASAGQPAFLSPPPGAPVYHGFPVVEGINVDGFQLGMITDFLSAPDTYGDGYVIAPDGSRAGLVWEAEVDHPYVIETLAPDARRWGVWSVGLPLPLTTREEAQAYLAALIPLLRPRWEAWKAREHPPS
jgi:hypothetical protein